MIWLIITIGVIGFALYQMIAGGGARAPDANERTEAGARPYRHGGDGL